MSIFVRRQVSITEWGCPGREEERAAKAKEDEEVKQGRVGSLSLLRTKLVLVLCAHNLETMPMEA